MSDTESRDLVSGGGAEAESATAHTAQSSSAILRRHRVKFVAASTEEQTVTQAAADRSRGQSVSSFYASLVGINKSPESDTPTPPRESPPETSIARLLEKTPVEAPIARLPVEEHSSGHRYLVRYGWHPLQPVGLGAPGREGRRVPVRAEVRPDYAGVGAKVKTRAADAKKQQDAPKKVTKAERKRLQREKTEREKRERQALYDEIVRGR
ncbi:hypothetical protein BZA70DRAFT_33778 [Myxozyma melibiosi]|uniref:G-patch domain-containing protein n=1 Tax=Myxozyma melibiosi TaxID=54550 RepID=A0ABR1FDY5_9ASCO